MPPKLVYYCQGLVAERRPAQDMGMPPQENTMNYATIKYCDIANGEGVRTSLFVPAAAATARTASMPWAWDFGYGAPFTKEVRNEILESLAPGYINGLSLLGGEPLEPENQRELLPFIKNVKVLYPNKTIWCYTGKQSGARDLAARSRAMRGHDEFLQYIDVLVDGDFVQDQYDISLRFRGSSNQRIIDMNKTRAAAGSFVARPTICGSHDVMEIARADCISARGASRTPPPPQTERQNCRVRRCAARGFPARTHLPYARGPGLPGPYCAVTIKNRSKTIHHEHHLKIQNHD